MLKALFLFSALGQNLSTLIQLGIAPRAGIDDLLQPSFLASHFAATSFLNFLLLTFEEGFSNSRCLVTTLLPQRNLKISQSLFSCLPFHLPFPSSHIFPSIPSSFHGSPEATIFPSIGAKFPQDGEEPFN